MLRTLRLTVLLIIGVVVLSACHDNLPKPDEPTPVQKTILMYLPFTESPSLYSAFAGNITDIESSILEHRGLGDNRYLIFISRSSSEAHLYELRYSNSRVVKDTLETYHNPQLTTVEGLSGILTKVKAIAPANKYGMVIGCHGEGWIPANPQQAKSRARYFGSGAIGLRTDITTLASAIEASNLHLQFLLFDVCYMSGIEVAYDLRRVTDRLIASTSEVMDYGMPYKKVLPYLLLDEPDYEKVNSLYLDFYSAYESPYSTLAITNTEYAEEMAALMKEINAQYAISSEQLENVQDLDAGRYTPNVYFDFGDYIDKMLEDDGDETKAELRKRFHELMDKLVPYKSTTGEIISATPYKKIKVNAYSGLTISDPSIHKTAVESKTTTNWWKVTH